MKSFQTSFAVLSAVVLFGAACVPLDQSSLNGETVAGDFPGHAVTQGAITEADFAFRVKALSDDRFGGRGPGTPSGEAAADWIANEMQRIGLKPGNKGSYFQTVPSASIELDPQASKFEIKGKDGAVNLKSGDEVAFWTPRFNKPEQSVANSDLVFVGYGVHAPEQQWDDFKNIDVKGKTLVLMINDPGFITKDEALFKGRAMTYYGRWTYKF